VPKPRDWPDHIDVCGFFFRENPTYTPPDDLAAFLKAGPPPVYLGFGSIVLDDPKQMLDIILEAVRLAGVRAIISKGWSDFGGDVDTGNVYYIGDCPHEWLFPRMGAVVHHGGAGTTACGLKNGVPTLVIPFFGDQPFWGHMCASAGVGPEPIAPRNLTAKGLCEAIHVCLTKEARTSAQAVGERMRHEDGVRAAVESFHKHLAPTELKCDLMPDQAAVWTCKSGRKQLKLSKLAAETIMLRRPALRKHLRTYQSRPMTIETRRFEPISASASSTMTTFVDLTGCVTGMVTKPIEEHQERRRRQSRADELAALVDKHRQKPLDVDNDKASVRSGVSTISRRAIPNRTTSSGQVALASAKSIGNIAPKAISALLVDIPVSLADGFKAIPSQYGDSMPDTGKVNGAGSGFAVASKTFAYGTIGGLSDFFVQPYKEVKKSGAGGLANGIGKGTVGLVSKTGAGTIGLVAYSAQGIAKSLRSATHSRSRKSIEAERSSEGQWLVLRRQMDEREVDALVYAFDAMGFAKLAKERKEEVKAYDGV
jgi:hypothetical protein